MYRCEFCNATIPANTPSRRVVVETRPRTYPYRPEANKFLKKRKIEKRDDPGGHGTEIARELIACPSCAAKK